MAIVYGPVIPPEDYRTFTAVLGDDVPNTCDEYADLILDQVHQDSIAGHTSRCVDVNPDEFAVWLAVHRQDRTLDGLHRYVAFKGRLMNHD